MFINRYVIIYQLKEVKMKSFKDYITMNEKEVGLDEDINVNARTYNLHNMDVTSLKNNFIANSGLSGMTSKISKIISQKPIAGGWEFELQMENGNKETVRMKVLTVEISQV